MCDAPVIVQERPAIAEDARYEIRVRALAAKIQRVEMAANACQSCLEIVNPTSE